MLRFYFDEMMRRVVARQLGEHGIEVIMAADVGMQGKDDPEHLDYATQHNAVLITFDRPFANLTSQRIDHAGLICWTGSDSDIGGLVKTLSAFANQYSSQDTAGRVFWLK